MKRHIVALVAVAMIAGVLGAWMGARVLSAPPQTTYQPGWANVAYAGETGPIQQKLASVVQASAIIYHLDNSSGAWSKYIPARPELSDLVTVTKGEAYLALLTQAATVDIASCPSAPVCPSPTPICGEGGLCLSGQQWMTTANQWKALEEICAAQLQVAVDDLNLCNAYFGQCNAALSACLH